MKQPKNNNQLNPSLSKEQKDTLFNKGTEAPGSGKYLHEKRPGVYSCANCGTELFSSESKYDSRTPGLIGWPSFDSSMGDSVVETIDYSLGMARTEIICANCGGHLGHVFDADDSSTGKHYCVNSSSLDFSQKDKK